MFGLDERIAALNSGNALLMVIGVAVLLGLRHATDPDHLTAVSTLIASERDRRTRRAATLGLAGGTGHALSLFTFGLPIVLFDQYLPDRVAQAAEVLIGIVIVSLAVRLLSLSMFTRPKRVPPPARSGSDCFTGSAARRASASCEPRALLVLLHDLDEALETESLEEPLSDLLAAQTGLVDVGTAKVMASGAALPDPLL